MSQDADKARAAVENLLFQCAGGTPGQSLLIVHENKGDGFTERICILLLLIRPKAGLFGRILCGCL